MTVAARPNIERKTFVLSKASIDASGNLSGYGAIFGNRDDGGDIIEPGFFDDVLGDFLKEGFISWSHDWSIPCAMPTLAQVDPVGMKLGAKFHSDAESQRYRTIAAERLEAGLTMGLSIGYEIAPGGAKRGPDGRHLLKASRLFEVALVLVPMNREAGATDVKTLQKAAADNVSSASYILTTILRLIQSEAEDLDPADPDFAEDQQDVSTLGAIRDLITQYIASTAAEVGTADDLADVAEEAAARSAYWDDWGWMGRTLPLAKQLDELSSANGVALKRIKNLLRLRKEGRVLSSGNRERLQGHVDTLSAMVDDMKDLLASSETEKGSDLALDFEIAMARSRGVPLPV